METYAVGVDIGGTKTALGLVDVAGRIVAEQSFPTEPAAGFGEFMDRL